MRRHIVLSTVVVSLVLVLGVQSGFVKTKVTYWNMGASQEYIDHMVAKFNAEHSDIEIDAFRMAGNFADVSQIVAGHVGGDVPDLIYLDLGAMRSLKYSGIVMDLTPYIEREGWNMEEEWNPAMLQKVVESGRYYAIPRDALVMTALFRNMELFAQVGLDPNQAPATYDEFEDADKRLTRIGSDGMATQAGFIPWIHLGQYGSIWSLLWGSNWWDPFAHRPILNGPRNLEMMEWMENWAKRTFPVLGTSWGTTHFYNGQLAMAMIGGEQLNALRAGNIDVGSVGITPMPVAPGDDRPRLYVSGEGFVIPTLAKNKDAAWEVIKWLLEPENAAEFALISGKPPARRSGAQYFMSQLSDPTYLALMDVTLVTDPVATDSNGPLGTEAGWTLLQQAVRSVSRLEESARNALDRVQAVSEGIVNDYLEREGPWW